MNPNYARLTPAETLAACEAITAHVTSPSNPFNLDAETLGAISGAHNTLAAAAEAQRLGALDQKQKTAAKDAALHGAGTILAFATKVALASNATDVQLRGIGLARPAKPVRPTAIPSPVGLLATSLGDSRTKVSFLRNGSTYGTTYEIFWSPDGVAYQMVATTTKTSFVLDSQPAGVAAWYKVRAARAGLVSPFSNDASVFAPGAPARVQLKVA